MRQLFAVVIGLVVGCQSTTCLAVLATFKAIDGQYADPDASSESGTVNLWTNTPAGNNSQHGSFLGNSVNNSSGTNNGSAGAGTSAWTLYANSGQTSRSDATIAPHVGRHLGSQGDFIALDFDNGVVQSGGEVGVLFFDSSNAHQLTFRLQGGDATYELVDDGGIHNTSIPATGNGFRLTLTLANTGGGYSLNVFNTQSSGPINTTISSRLFEQNTSTIAAMRVYDFNSGNAPLFDVFFNNVAISTVPEASALLAIPFAVVVAGAANWAGRRVRKSARPGLQR